MDKNELIRAKLAMDRLKSWLEPERFVASDLLKKNVPGVFPVPKPGEMPGPGFGVSEEGLKALADFLAGREFDEAVMEQTTGVSAGALMAALKAADPVKKPMPEKLVLVTCDDSTIDHYNIVAPVMERFGGHANFFTTEMECNMFNGTNFADKNLYMTWEQIRELSDRGHMICNHTWHHNCTFTEVDDATIISEVRGLEECCDKYGIPKPTAIGCPGGQCDPHVLELLHELGYKWQRGTMVSGSPIVTGSALYDPYVDDPLAMPSVHAFTLDAVKEALDKCVSGKVMGLVFHDVTDHRMGPDFEETIATVYENGGRCITYRELEEYVDADVAYENARMTLAGLQ